MLQLFNVPVVPLEASNTLSVQMPLGLIVPMPLKEETVGTVVQMVDKLPAGKYVPVYGAPPAETAAEPLLLKTVLVKLAPFWPVFTRLSTAPVGDTRNNRICETEL